MKRIETIIRNQKIVANYAKLICNGDSDSIALETCSDLFELKESTIQAIIDDNAKRFNRKKTEFNKCPVKIRWTNNITYEEIS